MGSRCSPDISMALFLKVLITVPSFLRRSGELRLSATFCFNRERTFRLGSETGRETRRDRGGRERESLEPKQSILIGANQRLLLCYPTLIPPKLGKEHKKTNNNNNNSITRSCTHVVIPYDMHSCV